MAQYSLEEARRAREAYKRMSPGGRQCLQDMLNEKRITPFPYYSAVCISAAQVDVGGTHFTYTVTKGTEFRAFSYAAKSSPSAESAGFPTGYIATFADTNLAIASKTKDGDVVEVHGICAQIIPSYPSVETGQTEVRNTRLTDSRWLALLGGAISVGFSLAGGDSLFQLGILGMLPGAGGFIGGGVDQLGTQQLEGGRREFGFTANGEPNTHNFFRLPLGHVWQDEGTDSLLQIVYKFERDVIAYSGGDLDNIATDEAATNSIAADDATGVRGYNYPARLGAGVMTLLKGTTLKYRSVNQ